MTDLDLTTDHTDLSDALQTRRYFRKFDWITGHLERVAAVMHTQDTFTKVEMSVIGRYLRNLSFTFSALASKYLLTGRIHGPSAGSLTIDRHESGFPVHTELLTMANDAQQAGRHLRNMPTEDSLKDQMIHQIIGQQTVPTRLQFALSQRLYYQELATGEMFWAQNDPETVWMGNNGDRRQFLIHWAVYDSQNNLPTIYLMEVEDTGRTALPKDERRWPEAQRHLMAQSAGTLKLLTIAKGFDEDFDDLHPKMFRRIHVGPMYSSAFTAQSGPIREVLDKARAPEGDDWALAWTVEELESERVETLKSGWFSTIEREIFALDPFAGHGADTGATRTERAIIMPERPFQALSELNPPGFASVRKFVVGHDGRVLSYR